jgi:hypothetical protein
MVGARVALQRRCRAYGVILVGEWYSVSAWGALGLNLYAGSGR